jgi:negative regulator of replication initiation
MVASARELERRSGVVRLIKSGLAASSPEEHQEVQEKINRYMQPVRETRIMTADDSMRRMLAAAQSEQERCPESALEDRIRETWLRVVCPDLGARQWLEGPGETAVLEIVRDDPDLTTAVTAAMADYRRDVAAARRDSIDAVMAVRRMVVQDDSSLSDAAVRQHSAIAERLWSPQDRAFARLRGILQGERLAKFNALLAKAQANEGAYAQRPKNWIDKRLAKDAPR